MENFWEFSVWGTVVVLAVLMVGILLGNVLKKTVPFLRASLIPTSVLGGLIILIIATVYKLCTGNVLFEAAVFGTNGTTTLETLTYHCLALGFIAATLKTSDRKFTKKRNVEIFNTGVTTVSSYLLQGIFGLGVTIIAALIIKEFFCAAGLLLPFGFGQGTGQALNYGNIYWIDYGFEGGRHFGLTIAALGFLSAALGGIIHLNVLRKRGVIKVSEEKGEGDSALQIEGNNEIPMQESIDKLTIQLALIGATYVGTFIVMYVLGSLLPGMRAVIFGFNFLIGVLVALLTKSILRGLKKSGVVKKQYTNNFLLTRTSNMFFDLMVIAGIAAIRLDLLQKYWGILVILALGGILFTYAYNRFVAKKLFKEYQEEQFMMMYGMLTGTASTGIILLREIDKEFTTPAAENMVYQQIPAIVFGFPLMFLALLAPVKPVLTWLILVGFFLVMNVILFRKFIFRRKKARDTVNE